MLFGVEESQGLNFAVHIDEVLDFIKQVENGNYPVESDNVFEKELWSTIDLIKMVLMMDLSSIIMAVHG